MKPQSVPERLTKNRFLLDEEQCHIKVNQEIAKATGSGKAIVACCPAHVYTEEPDGTISVEYAACLECGTCLAIAAPGARSGRAPVLISCSGRTRSFGPSRRPTPKTTRKRSSSMTSWRRG